MIAVAPASKGAWQFWARHDDPTAKLTILLVASALLACAASADAAVFNVAGGDVAGLIAAASRYATG